MQQVALKLPDRLKGKLSKLNKRPPDHRHGEVVKYMALEDHNDPQAESFRKAIEADPFNHDLHGVTADWLEEQGDPDYEFHRAVWQHKPTVKDLNPWREISISGDWRYPGSVEYATHGMVDHHGSIVAPGELWEPAYDNMEEAIQGGEYSGAITVQHPEGHDVTFYYDVTKPHELLKKWYESLEEPQQYSRLSKLKSLLHKRKTQSFDEVLNELGFENPEKKQKYAKTSTTWSGYQEPGLSRVNAAPKWSWRALPARMKNIFDTRRKDLSSKPNLPSPYTFDERLAHTDYDEEDTLRQAGWIPTVSTAVKAFRWNESTQKKGTGNLLVIYRGGRGTAYDYPSVPSWVAQRLWAAASKGREMYYHIGPEYSTNPNTRQRRFQRLADKIRYNRSGVVRYEQPQQSTIISSPNEDVGLDFDSALKRLHSPHQQTYKGVIGSVLSQLGIEANSLDAVGDWSDDAENSVVSVINGPIDPEQLHYAAAHIGTFGNQKSNLIFQENHNGPDSLYDVFVPSTNLEKIRENLTINGITHRTLVPTKNGTIVMYYDEGRNSRDNIAKFAGIYNATVRESAGQGKFIGDDTNSPTRVNARAKYREIIDAYESAGGSSRGSDSPQQSPIRSGDTESKLAYARTTGEGNPGISSSTSSSTATPKPSGNDVKLPDWIDPATLQPATNFTGTAFDPHDHSNVTPIPQPRIVNLTPAHGLSKDFFDKKHFSNFINRSVEGLEELGQGVANIGTKANDFLENATDKFKGWLSKRGGKGGKLIARLLGNPEDVEQIPQDDMTFNPDSPQQTWWGDTLPHNQKYSRIEVPKENLWTGPDGGEYKSIFTVEPDLKYQTDIIPVASRYGKDGPFPDEALEASFQQIYPQDSYTKTGTGHSHEVFSEVVKRLAQFMIKRKPNYLAFTSTDPNRFRLYSMLAQKLGKHTSYDVEEKDIPENIKGWLLKRNYARQWPNENTTDPWERSILEHLNNNPNDWDSHGVYADWLEEAGRVDEAEFHRNQANIWKQGTRRQPYTSSGEIASSSFDSDSPSPGITPHTEKMESLMNSFVGKDLFKFLPRDAFGRPPMRRYRDIDEDAGLAHYQTPQKANEALKRAFLRMKARGGKLPLSTLPKQSFPFHPTPVRNPQRPINHQPDIAPLHDFNQQYARIKSPPGGIIIRGLFYQGGKWIPVKHTERAKPISTPIPPVI